MHGYDKIFDKSIIFFPVTFFFLKKYGRIVCQGFNRDWEEKNEPVQEIGY